MSSHRVQPCAEVRVLRGWREFLRGIHEPVAPVTPLWSPDPPSVPAGHVWTLPGVGTSKLSRALWWGEPGNLRDNVHLIHLRLSQPLTISPGGHGYSTSQSAEDQRAHEEDA